MGKKVVEKITYEKWKQQLITVTAKETGRDISEININDEGGKAWFNDGFTPLMTFRETYEMEDDCGY